MRQRVSGRQGLCAQSTRPPPAPQDGGGHALQKSPKHLIKNDLHSLVSMKIRIKDVARQAGVSTGTVDRVLHQRGYVSDVARAKVEAAMRELGYEPNLLASALAKQRRLRLVALLPDPASDLYWAQVHRGVQRAARELLDFGVEVHTEGFALTDAAGFAHKAQALLPAPPDGLLFAPVFLRESQALLAEAWVSELPNVMINTRVAHGESLSYIGQDSYQAGVLAARLLDFGLQHGQAAALLNLEQGPTNAQHLIDKEQGFRDYFGARAGKAVEVVKYDVEDFAQAPALRRFVRALHSAHPRLGGIFVTNSRAHLLVDALAKADAPTPLVGFDLIAPNLQALQEGHIQFLINQNPGRQGYDGVMSLFKHLVLGEETPTQQYLPLDVVVRENARYYGEG